MLVLAFDTATPAVTVAVHDGDRVLADATTIDARRHGELLVPAIGHVLSEAGADRSDLTAIAVGTGPGPYTGLRVGLMTAQALSTALGVPAYGVCTLDVLAHETGLETQFTVATDARRKEVFWARYGDARTRFLGPSVDKPADVATDEPVAGAGAVLYPEAFPNATGPEHPSAGALAALVVERLRAGGELDAPWPIYLRRPDAKVPAAPKKVSQ
ncbi:tRNA (adenosine(37)-N6)-threonylcarbamoyltransferase complex dimerization subunit type 1 TsaB [Bailinhaonella thermotolerans]|uniref:tRNA (Adenosine(37)-N6)-threonylcarbamoyltransferase complex dimerization subunit type 1 TsaB n=1 Tax=Bailinhaonella thermotolerans TaxID=1070861 RepID=A0A3A4AQI3_9ACTN|nr:tRNA (adenosine(37)-N6)-threonylcarbamoyltransferase complex dimerization subunit type 1 TsaB [Bailinhaonella thermotolerans]RJL23568.1 tRNA (adenosine(37)-N6)-threonylcarbamoyltransferase complex dimerization subunit type 1 TsaB [Bailinhaonella thermotolerans]